MRLVQTGELPIEFKKSSGRGGSYSRRVVFRGDLENAGNFSLIIYYHDGSFYSPRHHHNFDQFRYQMDGDNDFSRNGKMKPGMLGYFPEGAYYGPQSGPPHTVAVLQFGGPSGSGYMGIQSMGAGDELRSLGTFADGIFRRNPGVEGRRNQDGYEAIWEHVNKRRLVYPKPQYVAPIMIDTNACPATPVDGAPGVTERALGTFTNCQFRAARYALNSGANLRLAERGVYLVLSGEGEVAGEPFCEGTVVHLEDGEEATFSAATVGDILMLGLPSLDRIAQHQQSSDVLQAAE